MQKKLQNVVVVVIFCLLCCGQVLAQFEDKMFFYNAAGKYSFSYPQDWKILTTEEYVRVLPIREDTASFIEPLLQITTTAWSSNLEDFVKINFNSNVLGERYRKFRLLGEQQETIDGTPAHKIEFSYELTGEAVQAVCYMIGKNNRVYHLMGIGPQKNFETKFKSEYLNIAHSLRIVSFIMPE